MGLLVEVVKSQVTIADLEFQFIRYKILIKGVLFVVLGKLCIFNVPHFP